MSTIIFNVFSHYRSILFRNIANTHYASTNFKIPIFEGFNDLTKSVPPDKWNRPLAIFVLKNIYLFSHYSSPE
uniref:Uncharacterized protein n=1 Tax=Ralstonia solanacearum TaxID=305 RepID=A0A0S4X251_RALSL|nr:protein of unknown function [Ralstonia solanacearum]